jgi:3-deoxy-D-manno-octulosonic-acid transferase
MLRCFEHLFVQNNESVLLLQSIGIENVSISGDTRFDRVIEIAENFTPIPEIDLFCGNSPVIVAGSTWTEDDKELDHYANTRTHIKFIIAPHNVERDRINECLHLYKNAVLFSSLTANANFDGKNTLIIDNIGMLSRLYRYATICYIGGGFGAGGIHNVLEAAVYGKPAFFGPEYDKYLEAKELIEQKGAVSVTTALELEKSIDQLFEQKDEYENMCKAAHHYVYHKQGAANKIVDYIYAKRLLTT